MTPPALAERGYLEVARRRWPILAGSVVAGLLLGSVTGSLSSDGYTSDATVALRPIVADPFAPNLRPSDSIDVATERQIARSRTVASRAAAALGLEEIDDIDDVSQVEQVGEALALRFTVTDDTPEEARDKADALANAYLQQRREGAEALVTDIVSKLDLQLLALGAPPVEVAPTDPASLALIERITALQTQKAALQALTTVPGTLIEPAGLAEETTGTPAWVGRVGSLALMVLVGFGIAVALDRRDRRIRGASDVVAVAGPVLSVIPVARGGSSADAATRSEAIRLLRLRLARSGSATLRRVVLAAPVTGPPVDAVALALATELASDGGAVLVRIDEQASGPNLVDAAAGRVTLEEVLQQGPAPGLRITEIDLGSGDDPSLTVAAVLDQLAGRADHVVCTGPPVLETAAGLELAVAADVVIVVADAHSTKLEELAATVEALDGVKASFAGTVLVGARR